VDDVTTTTTITATTIAIAAIAGGLAVAGPADGVGGQACLPRTQPPNVNNAEVIAGGKHNPIAATAHRAETA
jgi:hypothetical protein